MIKYVYGIWLQNVSFSYDLSLQITVIARFDYLSKQNNQKQMRICSQ